MSEPPQEQNSEKKPSSPPKPPAPPAGGAPPPPSDEAAASGDQPRHARRAFEEAYNNYLQRRMKLWLGLQEHLGEALSKYMAALHDAALKSQKDYADAYRTYLDALGKSVESEEDRRRTEEAYRACMMPSPDLALKHFDAYREYTQTLSRLWEEWQRGEREAHDDYVREITGAWSGIGDTRLDPHSLSGIGQSMVAVAHYAAEVSGPHRW